jgi:hypothetical protein
MSTTILDLRVREEMAGAVLKEVAALEPTERLQQAQALMQILGQAVQGLEDLWRGLRGPLQHGVSPSAAASLAQILTRSANLIASSLELLAGDNLALKEFREATLARLQPIKALAASLRGLVEMPAPVLDPHRLPKSLEQMESGNPIDPEDLLAQLRG